MIQIFTGIIEEIGVVLKITPGSDSYRITIQANKVLSDVKLGDSIAINGVCLTVVDYQQQNFTADVMSETLKKSSLRSLKVGDKLNLERALCLGDRLGGHLVQGHVDGVGKIIAIEKVDIASIISIKAESEILRYAVNKGSIAVDGISLTIMRLTADNLAVSLIPHTAAMTTLAFKKVGDEVNLESDIIGRYIEKLLLVPKEQPQKTVLTKDFLSLHGFTEQ